MKNKNLLLFMLFLMMFGMGNLFAQCDIVITDGQPFIEDFENNGFDCWTVENNGGGWSAVTGSQSTVAYFTYHNVGDEARLISPILDMSAVASVNFSFSFAMIGLYQNDELVVSYRSSESDEWHDLGTYSYSDYSMVYEETFTLDNLSSTYQVSFLGRGLGGLYMMIDNIEISSTGGGCSRPVNLQVLEKTAFSALLGWSTTGQEESWMLDVNGQVKTIDAMPFLVQELEPQTEYTFRVKANCENGMESEWSVPMTFQTLCDVITVTDEEPFFDDFEASEDFICWQNEIISGQDAWVIDPGYLVLNNTAFFIWLGGEARLITAPLDITAVTNPTLTFNHKQPHGVFYDADELSVWYRTSANDDWHLLGEYVLVADSWETVTIALPEPSDNYYICFKGKANDANGIYVDDVRIGNYQGEGIVESPAFMANVSPNPATDIVKISANITEGEVMVFDMSGRKMAVGTLLGGNVEFDLSGFSQGVYMVQITSSEGTNTIKLIKE